MDYYLIKGYFHVVGYSPDGDSLMFEASSKKRWDKIESSHRDTFLEKLEENEGAVQLRLQGVDALETHYSASPLPTPSAYRGKSYSKAEKPKTRQHRQPEEFGDAATARLLEYLDVESATWGSFFGRHYIKEINIKRGTRTSTYKTKNKDKIPGYIIVNDYDRKGRPIAWIFGGKTSTRDGTRFTTSRLKSRLKQSINYKLVADGMVYPYFFFTLAASLRDVLVEGVKKAQADKLNLWSKDRSEKGITLRRFDQITDDYLIFPYLFRRLVKHQFRRQMEGYWEASANKKSYTPSETKLFLESFFKDSNPYVFKIDERDFVRLDEIVYVTKTKLRLKTHPGNIVFLG
ncbi:MAG: hypothetical protein AAFR61_00180 [Bacteroidota bacterium]